MAGPVQSESRAGNGGSADGRDSVGGSDAGSSGACSMMVIREKRVASDFSQERLKFDFFVPLPYGTLFFNDLA